MIAPPLASCSWRLRAAAAVVVVAGRLVVPGGWAAVKAAAADAYLLAVFGGSDGEPGVRRYLYRDRESEPWRKYARGGAKVAAVDSEIKVESEYSHSNEN